MPTGLPTTSPTIIPKLFTETSVWVNPASKRIPVFAKANKGTMIYPTNGCKKRCSLAEADSSPPFPNGIAKANKTPLMVAWIPDLYIQYQRTTPGTKKNHKLVTPLLPATKSNRKIANAAPK